VLRLSLRADQDTTLGAFHVIGTLSGFSGSFLIFLLSLAGEGDLDFLGRLALLGLDGGGAGDIDLGRGDGAGAGTGICLGGDRDGLAGLGGAGAGAGEGFLRSKDIDLRAGAETFLGGGRLYSNLMASLILARLEAVLASAMD